MELAVDKNNYILSKRYANALIELSNNHELLEAYYNDLLSVLEAYKNTDAFKGAVNLPSIEKNKKKEILKSTFEGKINETVLKFLYVLIDSNRFNNLETIIYCFKQEKEKINNIINAEVISSIELKEDSKKNIQKILNDKTNKKVNIKYLTDSALIAGFVLRLDEKVIDLSLKNKIKEIRKQLI